MRFLGEKICWKNKPRRLLALGDDRNGFRAPSPSSSSSSMIEWGTSRTRQNPQTGFTSLLTLSFLSPTRSIFLSYSNGGNLFRSAIAGFWPWYASECTKRSIIMLFCVWRICLKWVHGISKPCFLGTFAAAAISFKPSSSVLSVLQREKKTLRFLYSSAVCQNSWYRNCIFSKIQYPYLLCLPLFLVMAIPGSLLQVNSSNRTWFAASQRTN